MPFSALGTCPRCLHQKMKEYREYGEYQNTQEFKEIITLAQD